MEVRAEFSFVFVGQTVDDGGLGRAGSNHQKTLILEEIAYVFFFFPFFFTFNHQNPSHCYEGASPCCGTEAPLFNPVVYSLVHYFCCCFRLFTLMF